MRRGLLGWLVCLGACVPASAGESAGESATSTEAGAESESETGELSPEAQGAVLYEQYCGFCHGDEGQGYAADNANALSNQEFLRLADEAFLAAAIRYGRPGTSMSAWGQVKAGPLSDAQIDHLVAYIKSWQTVPDADVDDYEIDPASSVIRGETYYGVYGCDECHGEQGRGGTYMTLENPWFLTMASDGYLRESIVRGRPGTPMGSYADGDMDDLTPAQIDDVIMLIRSWEREPDTEPLPPFVPDVSDAVINPDGPDPEFTLVDGRYIGVDAVKAALDAGAKMILLDARPHADFVEGHLAGAVSIPFFDLELVIDELPQDVWIINYCGCPHAVSGQSFDALDAAGFGQIAVLDEGYYEWVERGYPTAQGE
ncbi:c-type cytochrome [Enhygromyxa salina]|uniref:Rhodanese-like domain protein n=1 Tax=Enhygromyxa salina TaxID=215803 RepID=A0A2S9YV01_9BACT|nr:c-type cytochrome [Enhygromyxa salina]PRQ08931.1 Rhodanese-like domain protein [Enhygromyxa salina]